MFLVSNLGCLTRKAIVFPESKIYSTINRGTQKTPSPFLNFEDCGVLHPRPEFLVVSVRMRSVMELVSSGNKVSINCTFSPQEFSSKWQSSSKINVLH